MAHPSEAFDVGAAVADAVGLDVDAGGRRNDHTTLLQVFHFRNLNQYLRRLILNNEIP